jgi:hypothetical protein
VRLEEEDLDQQYGSRGPKRDNQNRHYAGENVEVIVVMRLMAAVGLRSKSIHGELLRNVGGLDWLYLLYAPSEFRQLLLGQAFRLRSWAKHIDLRPVQPPKLLDLDDVRANPHLEASREPFIEGHHILAWRHGLKSGLAKARSTAISTSNLRSVLPSTRLGFSPCEPAT